MGEQEIEPVPAGIETWTSGLVASATVAALHEVSRHLLRDAPRLDVMGERLIEVGFKKLGRKPPRQTRLLSWALGNVGSDTLVFAAVGVGHSKRPLVRGAIIGAVVGASALVLPRLLGVGEKQTTRNPKMSALTMGFYVAAGLAAGAARKLMEKLEAPEPVAAPQ